MTAAPVDIRGFDSAATGAPDAGDEGLRTARSARVLPLLDIDPDLGQLLSDDQRCEAHRRLLVRVMRLPTGPWDAEALTVADPGHLGLLLVDGIVMREVLTGVVAATELLGPGDIVRPWRLGEPAGLLQARVRWSVLAAARVALLDRRVAQQLGAFPEVSSLLAQRMDERSRRLAVSQAISQLNRVDQRLLTLFWLLAERWGRVTPEGVALPLPLSHRLLAQLVGARRPTVTTAAGQLAARGEIRRRPDGSWLLSGSPVGTPEAGVARFVPPRRRFVSVVAPAGTAPAATGLQTLE